MPIRVWIILIAGGLFLASAGGYIYAWVRLRPRDESDLDDYYYEFEDRHSGLARYEAWRRTTWAGIIAAMLLLFLVVVI